MLILHNQICSWSRCFYLQRQPTDMDDARQPRLCQLQYQVSVCCCDRSHYSRLYADIERRRLKPSIWRWVGRSQEVSHSVCVRVCECCHCSHALFFVQAIMCFVAVPTLVQLNQPVCIACVYVCMLPTLIVVQRPQVRCNSAKMRSNTSFWSPMKIQIVRK